MSEEATLDEFALNSESEWSKEKLRNLVEKDEAGVWGDESTGDGVKILRATNYGENKIDLSDVAIRDIPDSKRNSKQLTKGDIVVERSGGSADQPVGRVLFFDLEGEYYHGNFLRQLRPDTSKINSRYLYYRLDYDYRRGHTKPLQTNTTNIRNLQYSSYLNQNIPTPPTSQQRKIATALYTVDQAIENTEAIIGKMDTVRRGTEQDLLSRGILEDGTLRPEESTEYKSSWVGEVPKEWDVQPYAELISGSSVGIVVKPTQYYDKRGDVPILRSKDISRDGIVSGDFEYMTQESHEENSNSQLYTGDIITVRSGEPGLSCVVPSEFEGSNCADLLISTPGKNLDSHYAAMWINSRAGRKQIDRFQAGLAQKHFNLGALRELRVAVPPISEQQRIVEKVSTGSVESLDYVGMSQ